METKIYGHRGCMGTMPENTLLGFQQAVDDGVDGIELDVHLTKDGEVVVIHDETLDRTTDGTGWIKDLTLSEIKTYSAGRRGASFPKGEASWEEEKVPTLQEVLELLEPYPTELNIELKTTILPYEGIEEKVLSIVREYGNERKVIYSSFHLPTLLRIKQLDLSAVVAWVINQAPTHPQDYIRMLGLESLHLNQSAMFQSVYELKRMSEKIRVWTVNNSNDIKQLLDLRVGTIITDYPKDALFFRNEREAFA
ncbi:MAG TPA: glycerophosphodiester phosphodiesterase [Bacillota bacterium]|nr:glycerophosphodiester phosphodiesterase [Bacillota bacterium]